MFSVTTIVTLGLSVLATASPLATRDAGTNLLIKDLLVLDEAIKTITYAANSYTGGVAAYEPIRESFAAVNRTNRIAYYDAMKIDLRKDHIILAY